MNLNLIKKYQKNQSFPIYVMNKKLNLKKKFNLPPKNKLRVGCMCFKLWMRVHGGWSLLCGWWYGSFKKRFGSCFLMQWYAARSLKKSGDLYLSVDNPFSSRNPLLCGLHVIQSGSLRVDYFALKCYYPQFELWPMVMFLDSKNKNPL